MFPSYAGQLSTVPDTPDLRECIQMLTVLSREAGDRVKHRDGEKFRSDVLETAETASDFFNQMMDAQELADIHRYNTLLGKFSGCLSGLALLAEEGVEDVDEQAKFFKMTVEVCKRVESWENLKTQRLGVMSEGAVMKLIETIPIVLSKYLSPKSASAAYAELMEKFKMPGR